MRERKKRKRKEKEKERKTFRSKKLNNRLPSPILKEKSLLSFHNCCKEERREREKKRKRKRMRQRLEI